MLLNAFGNLISLPFTLWLFDHDFCFAFTMASSNQDVQVRVNIFYFFRYEGAQNLQFPSSIRRSSILFTIRLFLICLATTVMQMFEYLHDQNWEETARMSLQNGRQILLYELCVWNTEKAMQEQGKPVSFTVYHLQSLGLVVRMILPI